MPVGLQDASHGLGVIPFHTSERVELLQVNIGEACPLLEPFFHGLIEGFVAPNEATRERKPPRVVVFQNENF
jgi:hypothetical protein